VIDSYSFGSITIDGKQYTKDVIISHSGVLCPWWRSEGHSLEHSDLESILKENPEILVIGTGSFGVMKVPEETLEFLKEKAIEPRVMRTGKAVEEFNRLLNELGPDKVMAALHLTC
jgi:hypothetical protein